MNFLTTFLLCFFALFSVKAQSNSDLDKAIVKTINALNKQDFSTINDMILKDFGVAILFKRGAHDNLAFVDKLNKKTPVPEYLSYDYLGVVSTNFKIKHETLPEFDCDTEKFTKKRVFIAIMLQNTAIYQKRHFLKTNLWTLDGNLSK